ncbi:MAG: ABC transporter substrate-binding protein [Deltaproteobacteria bacterium]|nr:ABC transporter substrate-binding protein [Deltaproteobacteria bacterium]
MRAANIRAAAALSILAALAIFILAAPGSAKAADELGEVMKISREKISSVINILKTPGLSKKVRDEKIIHIVNPMLDFDQMAKLSLGKKHWLGLSKEQRTRFMDSFVNRLQESYLEKLDLYTDEEVVVDEAKEVKKRIHVLTYLVSKDDRKEMIYKFYKKTDSWMVYDVEILGVSVVMTYRSQFDGFLKTGTYEQLLEKLEKTGEFTIKTEDLKKK